MTLHALRSEIAAYKMIVEAKNDAADAFWRYHSFRPDPLKALRLIASQATLTLALSLT